MAIKRIISPRLRPIAPISTMEAPMAAKAFKDDFNRHAKNLANQNAAYRDENGVAQLTIKFLNGRVATIRLFENVADEDTDNTTVLHPCSHQTLKKCWGTVGAAIAFSVAFVFTVTNDDGEEVALILQRCADHRHLADDFVNGILAQCRSEFMAAGNVETELESKIDNLEENLVEKIDGLQSQLGEAVGLLSKLLDGRP